MPYIGALPDVGSFTKLDAITAVNGQAAYTMQVGSVNVSPQSANHMIVSLNGVIQKPGSSYTVSGNTITFASNLATGDVIDFIQILGDVLDLGVPSDATVTAAKLTANSITGQTAETSIATDDTLLIHDTSAGALRKMTRANFVSGIGGTNTPNFYAYRSGNQSLSDATTTKIQFNAETYDTANAFDSSTNYRFTPQTAGKYFLIGSFFVGGSSQDTEEAQIYIYKNGSSTFFYELDNRGGQNGYNTTLTVSAILEANGSSDYFEVYARVKGAGTKNLVSGANQCWFQGYKIIE